MTWSQVTPVSTVIEAYPGEPDFSQVTLEFDRPIPAPANWFLRAAVE